MIAFDALIEGYIRESEELEEFIRALQELEDSTEKTIKDLEQISKEMREII